MSVRNSSCSVPPCAEMVSARKENLERYIEGRTALSDGERRRYPPGSHFALSVMLSIKVPPLGESIVEATVSRWLKKQGDAVASGDTIVELDTDKITVEVPAPRAGVLASLAVAQGDVVKVDQVLAELDETAAGANAAPAEAAAAPAASAPEASAPEASAPAASPPPASGPAPTAPPAAPAGEVKSSPAARRAASEGGVSVADLPG